MSAVSATRMVLVVLVVALLLGGCGIFPDRGRDYQRSRIERTLEVPPGLTTASIQDALPVPGLEGTDGVSLSDYRDTPRGAEGRIGEAALPRAAAPERRRLAPAVRLAAGEGGSMELQLATDFERAWTIAGEALINRGVAIIDEDRRRGVYRVLWADPIQEGPQEETMLESLQFWRDPGERPPAEDRVYQVAMKSSGNLTRIVVFDQDDQRDRTNSGVRLLARLKRGVEIVTAPPERRREGLAPVAQVQRDARGDPELLIEGGYGEAWERVARALNRTEVDIVEADRTRGVYAVRYEGPAAEKEAGFFARMNLFSRGDKPNYLIAIKGSGAVAMATVFDVDGMREHSAAAVEILSLLEGAMLAGQIRTEGSASSAAVQARVEQGATGEVQLVVAEPFAQAWRLVGLALDEAGFEVEDRNRSRGVYAIRYRGGDPEGSEQPGFFSRVFAGTDEEGGGSRRYQIALREDAGSTRVVVFDAEGARESSGAANQILSVLAERIN